MPNWKKVIVSGSNASLNSLIVNNGITGSLSGTSSWAENALTSSNILGGTQYYIPVWDTNTSLSSSYLHQSGSILKTIYGGLDKGLTLDYNINSFILGNAGSGNNTYIQVYDDGSVINVNTPNYTYFSEKVGIRIIPTNPGLAISGSLEVTGPGTSKFMNSNVQIDGNLFMSGSNRLIYNNDATNNMLFGMFDGSNIYGPYYQIFGNNYSNVTQRGSAEFVYDNRNGGGSGFNIASFNGSTWTRRFRVDDNGAQVTGSLIVTGGITGSLFGTSSWAVSASSALYSVSSSYAATSSFADRTTQIDVYVKNMSGAQINKGTVVRIVGAVGDNPLIATASYTNDNNSANTLGITTQNIANGDFGYIISEGVLIGIDTSTPGWTAGQLLYLGANGAITGSAPKAPLHAVRLGEVLRVQQNNGSMYVRIDNGYELGELHDVVDTTTTSSYGDLLVRSGSVWTNSRQLTGSYGLTGSLTAINGGFTGSLLGTSSFAVEAVTASYADFFTVKNNAIVSGSLTILQNLTVFGSASITYITQSTLNIATNLITVNTDTPGVRFGGLAVIDSGSVPRVSGSWLFDSIQNRWLFVHQSSAGSAVTSSLGIMGPETYNNIGNETQITYNRITKGYSGTTGEHIGDSQISDDGTTVSIPGKLSVTSGITGSLFGTSSWANNASTASNAAVFNISSSLYSAQGTTAGVGTTVVASISTGSYRAGFFDYTVFNASNARAGTVISSWLNSSVSYTDTSNTDIGATNSVTMSVALNGGNIELRTTAGTTWTVKTTYRLI